MRVLVVGIAGALARLVSLRLLERGHVVAGIDSRPWWDVPKAIQVHQVDLRKRAAEDVFRRFKAEAVIHLATVSALNVTGEERSRINVGGTRAVFDHCQTHDVAHVVFVGRHTYYGAAPDSPLYHTEDEPPQALGTFPELADLVAADLYAANALWRWPRMVTTVLRLCYTLGPSKTGTLATFLRGRRVPMVLGFDPLFQFLHEDDAAMAVVCAVEQRIRGVYNVAGPPPLPLSTLAKETGRLPLPLPASVILKLMGRLGLPHLPRGALDHIKFPIVVDARAFARATGFKHSLDEVEVLRRYGA
jgi:UDP-glucose 4-epimerase